MRSSIPSPFWTSLPLNTDGTIRLKKNWWKVGSSGQRHVNYDVALFTPLWPPKPNFVIILTIVICIKRWVYVPCGLLVYLCMPTYAKTWRSRKWNFISVCNQPPRSTQPPTLRGTVKWVPAKGRWYSAACWRVKAGMACLQVKLCVAIPQRFGKCYI